MDKKEGLSKFQLFLILIHAQIGLGIITLPHDVFMTSNKSAWITILISGFIIQVFILIFGYIIKKFPSYSLPELIEKLLGRIPGKTLNVLYTIYFVLLASSLLAKYVVILKIWMMPVTPKWILVILVLITAVYAAKENLSIIARFFLIASSVLIIFLGLSTIALKESKFIYALPILKEGFQPVLKGIPKTINSFQGYETLLFIFPFVKGSPRDIVKTASMANLFVTFMYTFLVFVSIVFFSSPELTLVSEPVLYLVKSLSFRIIERPDLIFTSMWIVLIITSIIVLISLATISFTQVINQKKKTGVLYSLALLCFLLSMTVYGEYKTTNVIGLIQPLIFFFAFIIPFGLVLYSIIYHKIKGERQ